MTEMFSAIWARLLEPDKTQKAIEALSALPVAFAKAQFEAGAAAVVWADHMTSDLVSAELYKEMLLPTFGMNRLR